MVNLVRLVHDVQFLIEIQNCKKQIITVNHQGMPTLKSYLGSDKNWFSPLLTLVIIIGELLSLGNKASL